MWQKHRLLLFMCAATPLLLAASCSIERLFPGRVADGVARLSVNNLAKLILALSQIPSTDARPECDLENNFLPNPQIIDAGNGLGRATFTFKECTYDFGKDGTKIEFPSVCGLQEVVFFGKVTVSGKRSFSGLLTKNETTPIIPSGANALTYSFDKVVFENYRVESKSQNYALINNSGSVSFDIAVQLGKDEDSKRCKIPLQNPFLSNIQYAPNNDAAALVTLPGVFGNFQAEINKSNFSAQVSVDTANEENQKRPTNSLFGTLTVWNELIRLPSDGTSKLDPYLTENSAVTAFQESLRCTKDLEKNFAGTCTNTMETATDIGRLSVNNLARLIQSISKEQNAFPSSPFRKECNLSSLENPSLLPTTEYGDVVWEFRNCTYDFGAEGTDISLDHDPQSPPFRFFGKVTLSGSKTIFGRVSPKNYTLPVIPTKPAVTIKISEATFTGFEVRSQRRDERSRLAPSLVFDRARLSFAMIVRLEKHKLDVLRTPKTNFTINDFSFLGESLVTIEDSGDNYKFSVFGSNLHAQNERHQNEENVISGDMNIFGRRVSIPKQKLIPDKEPASSNFHHEQLESSLAKLDAFLADNAARLSIVNASYLLGALTKFNLDSIDSKPECNLGSLRDNPTYTTKVANDSSPVNSEIIWRFQDCTYDFGETGKKLRILPDKELTLFGRVTISGTRALQGILTGNETQPIISKDGHFKFILNNIQFSNFKVLTPGFDYTLTVDSAGSSFVAIIHLAINPETKLYSSPTGNITFEHFTYSRGTQLILTALEGEFLGEHHLNNVESNFKAQIQDNSIEGTFTVFGNKVTIPSDGQGLDPTQGPKSSQSHQNEHEHDSLEYFKAAMLARFLVRNLATIASESNSETLKTRLWPGCGFGSAWVRAFPSRTEGEVGQIGFVEYSINNCQIIPPETTSSIPNICLKGIETRVEGGVVVSGVQKIKGERSTYMSRPFAIPRNPESIEFDFSEIRPSGFTAYPRYNTNEPDFLGQLTLIDGSFAAKVFPKMTLSKSSNDPCYFDQPTPIAEFEIFDVNNLKVALSFSYERTPFLEKQVVTINSANIKAFNGFYNGVGNYLDGFIEINNEKFSFDKNIDVLVPDYDQESFDAEYRCRLNLDNKNGIRQIIDPNSFELPQECPRIK